MHVKVRTMASAGLLAAFSVILIILASIIESSSLFFIAAASFVVGIAIREWGLLWGTAMFLAITFLSILIAPNKMYCLTFAGMAIYLLGSELFYRWTKGKKVILWTLKYAFFNIIFVPVIIFLPHLIINKPLKGWMFWVVLFIGQIGIFVYDKAHDYVQIFVWNKLRGKIINRNL